MMIDTSKHLSKIELPSGLPEGPWRVHKNSRSIISKSGDTIAEALNPDIARSIASIPAMVEEIGRLRTQIGDNQALLDAAVAGLADNDRLRAQNAELRELIKPISKIPLWRDSYPDGPDQTVGEIGGYQTTIKITPDQVRKARAILAETEAAP